MGKLKAKMDEVAPMTTAVYTSIQAMIDGVDIDAVEMEKKWGVGRLRLLVSDDLRERFDRQAEKFNRAVWVADVGDVRKHGNGMHRAWQILDQAATEDGAKPLDPVVWETRLGDRVLAIVQTTAEAHAISGDGRAREVWTMEEIGRVLVAFSQQIGEAKQVFPGCEVVDVRPPPLDELVDDPIPI